MVQGSAQGQGYSLNKASASGPTERITNGSFASGANWNAGTWVIAVGVATAADGTSVLTQQLVAGSIPSGTSITLAYDLGNALGRSFTFFSIASNGTTQLETIGITSIDGHESLPFVLSTTMFYLGILCGGSGSSIDNISLIA